MFFKIIILIIALSSSTVVIGQNTPTKKKVVKKKAEKVRDGDYVRMDSTKLDFSEEQIEGRVKAPEGFFLRGRSAQDLMQMVNLRSTFREELKSSKNGAVSLTR